MTPAQHTHLKLKHMRWFLDQGIQIFPIQQRNKIPACPSWDDYVADPRELHTWHNYGVRLGSPGLTMGVVDSDTPAVEAWVQSAIAAGEFPQTPFTVTTARGIHRYYRLTGATTHFIHRAGHTIEFRNAGQYVVGPGCVHSSGAYYVAAHWSWRITDVPFFPVNTFAWEDRPEGERGSADGQKLLLPPVIRAGERHDLIFKLMRSLQARGMEDIDELLTTLRAENAAKCVPPIDDYELTKYIRRVAHYKDKPNFSRMEMIEAEALAGELIEMGASPQAAIAAAKAVDAEFDPSGATPKQTSAAKLNRQVEKLERQLAKAKESPGAEPLAADDTTEVVKFDDDAQALVGAEEIE